jgi:hypothetical protein
MAADDNPASSPNPQGQQLSEAERQRGFVFPPIPRRQQLDEGERQRGFVFPAPPEPPKEEPSATPRQMAVDVAQTLPAAAARGFIGMPGIAGDVGRLIDIAPASVSYYARRPFERLGIAESGVAERSYNAAMEALRKSQTPEERAGTWNRLAGISFPTSDYFIQGAEPYLPSALTYRPQTSAGRVADVLGSFVGGAPAGGAVRQGVRLLRGQTTVPRAIVGVPGEAVLPSTIGAGLGSGVAGEMLGDVIGEGPARILGALTGGAGGAAAERRLPSGVRERGNQIAGQLYRERLPEGTDTALTVPPGQFVEGATPTSAQLLGREGHQARLLGERFAPEGVAGSEANTRNAINASAGERLNAIEAAAPYRSMEEALDLPAGPNPLATSSQTARNNFDVIHDDFFQRQENAWSNPALSDARYNSAAVNNAANLTMEEIGSASFRNMPVELRRYIQELSSFGNDGIPLERLQTIKKLANAVIRDPNVRDPSGAIAFSRHLDNVMTNENNVIPGSIQGAASAWDRARTATREYHQTFGTDYLRSLARSYPEGSPQAGMPTVPAEQFFNRMFSSPQTALTRYNEIASLPNIDRVAFDRSAGDWLIAQLTKDGRNLNFTDRELINFRTNPAYSDVINQIPDMSDRLDDIGRQSISQRVAGEFRNILNSANTEQVPARLSNFLDKHGAELRQVLPESQHGFIDQLQRSSELLRPLSSGRQLDPSRVLNFMENGDLFSVLHGQALGLAPRFAAGTAAGYVTSTLVPQLAGYESLLGLGLGVGATGIPRNIAQIPTAIASRVFYGDVQRAAQEALARAAIDPPFLRELLRHPNPQDIFNPFSARGWAHGLTTITPNAAHYASLGLRAPEILQQQGEQQGPPQPPRLMQPRYQIPTLPDVNVTAPRPTRASGGRITSHHRAKAQALINAADRAKKTHNGTTKPILDMPDETVAKALSLADQAI